ncbi:MAG TPA: TetR/AcrR family transcriptional regulator [Soehngenia sp.]|nr:TetR/AcrR family transcriptional regulator [Soehngenia sp.]HPP31945.1 TetR/AcrR family transcriptional regulator [Soehngenia sp.]
MKDKNLQKKNMMLKFINAAEEIIEESGFNGVKIRDVAKKAGFNSATLYNYFENLDHLLFYTAMRSLKDYALALRTYLVDAKNAMDMFLKVWECFCDFAYDKPEIYNAIFFPNLDKHFEHYVDEYYKFFPEDLVKFDENITTMLLKSDIKERGKTTVSLCVEEGFIREEDAEKLNDMTLLIFEGMLKRVLRNQISYDDARNNTMEYIKNIVKVFLIKEYEFYY